MHFCVDLLFGEWRPSTALCIAYYAFTFGDRCLFVLIILLYCCRRCCCFECVFCSLSLCLPFLALFLKLFQFQFALGIFFFFNWNIFVWKERNWTVDVYCCMSFIFWTSCFWFECCFICPFSVFPLMFQVLLVSFYPLIMM